jgi:hypothetical protein
MGILRRVDRKSDLVEAYNRLADRDSGHNPESASQVLWTEYDGQILDPHGAEATPSDHGNAPFVLRSPIGHHRRTLLSGTAVGKEDTLSPANAVEIVNDDGLFIGAGKQLRLYGPAGTNYSALWGTDTGLANVLGQGADAGSMAFGPLPALTGKLRIPFGTYLKSRNQDNSGDIFLIGTTTGNYIQVGDMVASPILYLQSSISIIQRIAAVAVTTLDVTGKFSFLPAASRIMGDLTNAVLAARLAFQSSTVNGTSSLGVLPNGTGLVSDFAAYSTATPATAPVAAVLRATAIEAQLRSDSPSGAFQALGFYTSNLLRLGIDALGAVTLPGNLLVGGTLGVTGLSTFTGDVLLNGSPYTTVGFTPTLTQGGAVSHTVLDARYRIYGKLCHAMVRLRATGAGTAATLIEIGSWPAVIQPRAAASTIPVGTVHINRVAGVWVFGSAIFPTTSAVRGVIQNGANWIGADPSFALANGDTVAVNLIYEIA